jgi:hypothetical protein
MIYCSNIYCNFRLIGTVDWNSKIIILPFSTKVIDLGTWSDMMLWLTYTLKQKNIKLESSGCFEFFSLAAQ